MRNKEKPLSLICKIIVIAGLLITFLIKIGIYFNSYMVHEKIVKNVSVLKKITDIKDFDNKDYLPYDWDFLEDNVIRSKMMIQEQCFFDGLIIFLLFLNLVTQVSANRKSTNSV